MFEKKKKSFKNATRFRVLSIRIKLWMAVHSFDSDSYQEKNVDYTLNVYFEYYSEFRSFCSKIYMYIYYFDKNMFCKILSQR